MTDEERMAFHDLGNLATKYQSKWMNAERELKDERARSAKLLDALTYFAAKGFDEQVAKDAIAEYEAKE